MLWNNRRNDLASFDIGYLHAPEAGYVVHHLPAYAVDCIRSEDSGVGPDARDCVTTRIDHIEVVAASIGSFGLLEKGPGQRELSIVRPVRKVYLANYVTAVRI